MLSQNVAKVTVPSYSHIRTTIPHRQPFFQWQGVFYFSGITKRRQNGILLARKKAAQAASAQLQSRSTELSQKFEAIFASRVFRSSQIEEANHGGGRAADSPSSAVVPATAATVVTRVNSADWLEFAVELGSFGLVDLLAPVTDALHATGVLTSADYAQLISCCAADDLGASLCASLAGFDPALVPKLLADRRGSDRAAVARRVFSMAVDAGVTVTAAHFNALMKVLLTAGYDAACSVSGSLYDHMGVVGVQPNAATYELVLASLAMQGNTDEAEHVMLFLQSQCADHVTIGHYNAILAGFREARLYDKCDQLWQELCDRRWPRPSVATAEIYLRSIIDHSYQTMSDPMSKMSHINVVEKKKVPAVLAQMDDLALPRTLLSPPLLDEVEDALRKFSIYKSRFYEWGRATRQFDFIEYRRIHGWMMHDLREMVPTTVQSTPFRTPEDRQDASYAPAAVAETPSFFTERNAWDLPVLDDVLNVTERRERMEDVRSGDFYYDDRRSIHERPVGWMQQVPETRYDQLYGIANPDIPKVGIRRHLNAEYVNRTDVLEKDQTIMRKALSGGRRVRQKVESSKTHRSSSVAQGPGQSS